MQFSRVNASEIYHPLLKHALLHHSESLNRGFATILLLVVKPRELNEKPSSPSSSLESRAQSSSAELNQREAIKFSYCPMQPQPQPLHSIGRPSTRGQRNAKSRSRSAHGKSSFHWKGNDSGKNQENASYI